MDLTVSMAVDPADVEPGQRVLDARGRVLVVDEVSRSTKGVVIYGWPLHRPGEGNRASVKPGPEEPVIVVPNPNEEGDLRLALRNALLARFPEGPVGTFDIGGWKIEVSTGWFDEDDPSLDASDETDD